DPQTDYIFGNIAAVQEGRMNMRNFAMPVLLIGVTLAASFVSGQTVDVNLIETHFSVTDRNGKFVPNLKPSDFTVYDNDESQSIDNLEQNLQSPLDAAVILDRSASVTDRFRLVVDSASAFVTSLIRDSMDRGTIVAFDSKVYLLEDWSSDSNRLTGSFLKLN